MQFNYDLLKNLRKKLKITQEQTASACKVSQKTVSRWETGESEPSLEELQALANLLNVETYALIIEKVGKNSA